MRILCICVLAAFSLGAQSTQKSLLKSKPEKALLHEIVKFKPIENHHFNLEAPQRCGEIGFLEKTTQVLSCQFSKAGIYPMVISICDDKKTFCIPEKFNITVAGNAGSPDVSLNINQSKKNPQSESTHMSPPGFITNDPTKALAEAKMKNQLLFIDFFGIWCPPCNMLDENVFSTQEFQEVGQSFTRVRLDADSDISWEWKAHFKVGGYPTIIVANHKLEEIGRVVGYRPTQNLIRWMETQNTLKTSSIDAAVKTVATKKEKAKADQILRVGQWHYERSEFDKAVEILSYNKSTDSNYYTLKSKLNLADKSGDKTAKSNLLESLIKSFPQSVEFSSWVLDLHDTDAVKSAKFFPNAYDSISKWIVDPALANEDYAPGDLYYNQASLYEAEKKSAQALQSYSKCADAFADLAKTSHLSLPRGANLSRGHCLYKAERIKEAKELYHALLNTYPSEFTFNHNYARILFELKEHKEAYQWIEKAEMYSYGDNWLRTVKLKAEILAALGKEKEAIQTLQKAIDKAVLPESSAIRSHRYLQQIRDLLAKLSNA